jgi:hypothetical protein
MACLGVRYPCGVNQRIQSPQQRILHPGGCSAAMAVTAAGMTRPLILTTWIICGVRITRTPHVSTSARV